MSSLTKISIVIPVYNAELYLEECLQSVVNLQYENVETIVVDDGSTDSSFEICRRFFEAGRLTGALMHQDNAGPLHARQAAVRAATGDYIVCVDADDMLHPEALALINEAICATQTDIVVFNSAYALPMTDELAYPNGAIAPYFERTLSHEEILSLYCSRFGVYLWGKAIKRSLFFPELGSEFYSLRYAEDNLQSAYHFDRCNSAAYIPCYLYYHRCLASGLDGSFGVAQFNDHCTVQAQIRSLVEQWDARYPQAGLRTTYELASRTFVARKAFEWGSNRELLRAMSASSEVQVDYLSPSDYRHMGMLERVVFSLLKSGHIGTLAALSSAKKGLKGLKSSVSRIGTGKEGVSDVN